MVDTLLKLLEKVDGGVDSVEVASSIGVDHQLIVGAVKSLQSLGDVSFYPPESHRKSTFSVTDATRCWFGIKVGRCHS